LVKYKNLYKGFKKYSWINDKYFYQHVSKEDSNLEQEEQKLILENDDSNSEPEIGPPNFLKKKEKKKKDDRKDKREKKKKKKKDKNEKKSKKEKEKEKEKEREHQRDLNSNSD